MSRALADEVLDRLVGTYSAAREPVRAAQAAAYMRDQFPFLGLPAPTQTALNRTVWTGLPKPAEDDLRGIVLACWDLPEREYQYFACTYLRRHAAVTGPGFLATLRTLITTKSWWDTVDPLATWAVGGLVQRHPVLVAEMDAWATDENMWLVRTAILHQLRYGADTDTERLFGYCTRQAGHRDFFVRKAIGWALRQYARTDPDAVRRYVAAHRDQLSGLSVREATKHL
ncbi:3-methyladenine DNA glycosylase AlkD [Krasilnikovia cinnamomea]|uniref:3-methyladenine DNA glycosylase AlkD n=1 Tax=Krasilnikovia cinnamomea TaxID=349313 RepID=A0A4Q7ZR92_9ACTN|nr:DNA alkylation repair protein [Krasilnikovia cinnamomea]RZU53083.1 3-methyladenine DNA glycosylase AlkD [Krasilnikovia cinnamomea]